ncbi:hypothetical protein U9M48_001803 [Paspalum notatum var. saurae]|uniref:Uncharacterized protein n=1 Tax=Paspalum notatum var. saurae TaxID=547442 RepID=A0AAQ3PIT4_PASNO
MDLVVGASHNAAKSLVNKLGILLAQEYTLIQGVQDDVQYINDELASMQAFLNRLKREGGSHDEQRQDWMKQVREVAYDIEDCVDNVSHRLGGEPRGSGRLAALRRAWYLLTTLYARHCIAAEIGNLKIRAQHVGERRTRYGVENPASGGSAVGGEGDDDAPRDSPIPPPQLVGTMEPVGMDGAIKELEPWFAEENVDRQLRFLAIVGFGGLGKTTLAMVLHRNFGDRFDCRATVLASQKFHLLTVLRGLVKQIHEQQTAASKSHLDRMEEWGEEVLKKKLADQLKDKRYLLLIDDIWSVSAWEKIRDSLPKNDKGGSIVVTTRFKSVAEACRRQDGYVYEQKPLDNENAYKLFHRIISSAPDVPTSNAGAILKKCGGLPLAIIVVAGLVASKLKQGTHQEMDWHLVEVGKHLSEELGNNLTTEGVTHILSHCYNHLPADLKTCILYLSMFPKGCCISRKCLIRKWIAEGFITEKHGKTVEEVAEECFNELIARCLIRSVNNSSNGKVKRCQIHDMVHEFIVFKSSEENFITVVGGHWHTPFPSYKVRRLSVHKSDRQEKETVERMKLSHVRSFTALESLRAIHSTLLKFQILQVLDLEGCKDLSFHQLKKICKMPQLKYLSLRRTDIDRIPKKISRLENLEVLDIRETNVRSLPASVERLQRLVHLLAGNKKTRIALKLTEGITKMTALQTLSGVEICGSSIGTDKGRSTNGGTVTVKEPTISTGAEDTDGCRCFPQRFMTHLRCNAATTGFTKLWPVAALENLTNLKKLTIYRLGSFSDGDDILLLSAIEHLSSCSLKFLAIDDDYTGFLDSRFNSSQAPPEHLHSLGLLGKFSQVPKWIGRLHSLEKLTLSLTSLRTDALEVLAGLPQLFSLTFSLDAAKNDQTVLKILRKNTLESKGQIFVPAGGFKGLKLLRLLAPVLPSLSFLEGAMPELRRLELQFKMVDGVYGLTNIVNLQQVLLIVSSQAPQVAKAMVSQIRISASMIRETNAPSVVVDEYTEEAVAELLAR